LLLEDGRPAIIAEGMLETALHPITAGVLPADPGGRQFPRNADADQ
jgi:hypothetical protein